MALFSCIADYLWATDLTSPNLSIIVPILASKYIYLTGPSGQQGDFSQHFGLQATGILPSSIAPLYSPSHKLVRMVGSTPSW